MRQSRHKRLPSRHVRSMAARPARIAPQTAIARRPTDDAARRSNRTRSAYDVPRCVAHVDRDPRHAGGAGAVIVSDDTRPAVPAAPPEPAETALERSTRLQAAYQAHRVAWTEPRRLPDVRGKAPA